MLDKLWRRLVWRGVMRDADRLIAVHGRGAYGMARLGATAAREEQGCGHWSSVAHEIARRLEKEHRATAGGDVPGIAPWSQGEDLD